MASLSFITSSKEEISSLYNRVFNQPLSLMTAGIFIALSALMIAFFSDGAWGIAGGYRNWGDWVLYGTGLISEKPYAPWFHPIALSNIGLIAGAFASALMSKQFKVRLASGREYIKGLSGGILMGFGALLAGGCNVGGFYSGLGMFSLGGYAMMVGLGIGAFIGLKILMWELTSLPPAKQPAQKNRAGKLNTDRLNIQPWIGAAVLIFGVFIVYLFNTAAFNDLYQADTQGLGGVLLFALFIGLLMHRSRFCFVRAFRCPMMTGEAEMVKVVAVSLIIYGSGVAVLKSLFIIAETMGVNQPFFIGSLVGGIIFGVGMLLAGGCASSTLWRTGEGHTKLFVTLISFALTNAAGKLYLSKIAFFEKLGSDIYIPGFLEWKYTVPAFLLFLLMWVLVAVWNEKTDKFVLF